ncbi:MAG: STAS domain-containing protein [Planctomycetota bacterium]
MIDYTTYRSDSFPKVLVLEVTGRLDTTSADFLFSCMEGLIEKGERHIVLDCAGLEIVSSAGLATLVRANSRLKSKDGAIALANATGVVADVLRVTNLNRLFGLYSSVDEAANSLQAES